MFLCQNALRRSALYISVFGVVLSASLAGAQESEMTSSGPVSDQVGSSPEVVIVTPPGRGPTRSAIGAPIQDVSLSASVRTDDLNLQSPVGWLELRDRVRQTARSLCARLRFQNPIGTPDEFHCAQRAVEKTSDRIDAVLGVPDIQNP